MSESALTFEDFQTHLAVQLGVAYFGVAGITAAEPPTDTPTLQMIKDQVNGGIRMLLLDAPPEGWRAQQPVASLVLWATASSTANGAPIFATPISTVLANASIFYASMVGHKLKFTVTSTADGVPTYTTAIATSVVTVDDDIFNGVFAVGQTVTFSATGNSYTVTKITTAKIVVVDGDASGEADADTVTITRDYAIEAYTSPVSVDVTGDASGEVTAAAITVTADGNYTLPSDFGGETIGDITYAAATNVGLKIQWSNDGIIRGYRENVGTQTGYPYLAAVRKMDATNVARRWEMAVYPTPSGNFTVEFPYELHFTAMTSATDLHPFGVHYDEVVRAACSAFAELEGEDALAGRVQYYRDMALPGAYRINHRSAPKTVGSLRRRYTTGYQDLRDWRRHVPRQDVTGPT